MISVYALSADLKLIMSAIEENGGEISPDIEQRFNEVFKERAAKLEALATLMKTCNAETLIINAEIDRLSDLKKEAATRFERCEKMVRDILPIDEEFNSGLHQFSYKKCPPSVEVAAGVDLPECYLRTKIVSDVDKIKLRDDLKGGATIEGVRLVNDKFNLKMK